jgi:hypothetical protein
MTTQSFEHSFYVFRQRAVLAQSLTSATSENLTGNRALTQAFARTLLHNAMLRSGMRDIENPTEFTYAVFSEWFFHPVNHQPEALLGDFGVLNRLSDIEAVHLEAQEHTEFALAVTAGFLAYLHCRRLFEVETAKVYYTTLDRDYTSKAEVLHHRERSH